MFKIIYYVIELINILILKKIRQIVFYSCFTEGTMIKRNWILATFLILVLISLGCTSAAEDIQSDANMAVDDNINNEISVVENNELEDNDPIADEQLGDTNNVGTFTDLDNDINSAGNYYELTRDYT